VDNVCGVGSLQSPISISSKRDASTGQLSQLRFKEYEDTANILQIDGQTIIYRYSSTTAEMRDLSTGEGLFKPRYFSVHLPPEHSLPWPSGEKPAMELQFFHSSADGTFGVVVFFFKVVAENNPLLSFLDPSVIPEGRTTAEDVQITGINDFLMYIQHNYQDSYYFYLGSLTQPPCAERVQWYLIDTLFEVGQAQVDALAATLSREVSEGGNARDIQREFDNVLYYDSKANAISDPVCGGGKANWNSHPYDCTDQYDHTVCFYCSGRAHGSEARNMCFNRQGRGCDELFSSDEATSYCNLAFECPASTLTRSIFLLVAVLALLMWNNF